MPNPELAIERYSNNKVVVDSSSLFYFLAVRDLDYYPQQFNQYLDLSFFHPFMEYLDAHSAEGFIHKPEQRNEFLSWGQYFTEKGLGGGFEEYYVEKANKKAPVERSSIVYLENPTENITQTAPIFGEYMEGIVETYKVEDAGHIPLIEMHTHPHNSIFSPVDYLRVLDDVYRGKRAVKSAIVLTPNTQILALPTKNTPLFATQKEIDEYKEHWEAEYKDRDPEEKWLLRKATLINSAIMDFEMQNNRRILEEAEKFFDARRGSLLTQPEKDKLGEEFLQTIGSAYQDKAEKFNEEYSVLYNNAAMDYMDHSSRADNMISLSLARSLNILLYKSTNMRDFYAFSA